MPQVPIRWVKTYDMLQDKLKLKPPQQYTNLDEVRRIAMQCGLPHSGLELDTEVENMLQFFHELGAVHKLADSSHQQLRAAASSHQQVPA